MLEKIGLPPKPSLRGNNWVIDATHCQGCSSQFTFINRKHHCRRCGGLFCGSCTQQRMYLRGQGESPVRICEPCKSLEEAARFEQRYGHKNKSRKGASKPDNEDDGSVNGSISSDKEPVSSASSSTIDMEIDLESTTPEELRQRAIEEKNKYKLLKAEKKPEEALKAFKRGKELERQAATLEIQLRKNLKKALSSTDANENSKVSKKPKEKDDLASELRELGWTDHDINNDKKPVSMTLEGELSSLLKEVSQKSNKPEKGILGIDRSEVLTIKKNALALKREGKLTEAKEELKRAKILEKQIEEKELLGDDEDDQDSDDEFTSLIRSMDIDKKDILAHGFDRNPKVDFDFDQVLHMDDGNFDVTEDDMDDPEMSAALQSLGWTEDQDHEVVDKESLLSEIKSLKQEALVQKRAGNTAEALALLKKAKLLEANASGTDHKIDDVALSKPKLETDPKRETKSKMEIQRELLALKKKALALRREGKVDEADQELMKGKALEQRLEELESGQKVNTPPKVRPVDFSAPVMEVVEDEGEDVTDTDMNDPSYLALLENLGWQDDVAPKQQKVVPKKSKGEIQRELLALKRKSLALRRQGNVEEAEEVLKGAKDLEAQLEEMEMPSQETGLTKNPHEKMVVSESLEIGKAHMQIKEESLEHGKAQTRIKQESLEHGNIKPSQEPILTKNPPEKTVVSEVSVHGKSQMPIREESLLHGKPQTPIKVESLEHGKAQIQVKQESLEPEKPRDGLTESNSVKQQILAHKRKAVSLKREGKLAEAKEELKLAKLLEKESMEAHNKPMDLHTEDKDKTPVTPIASTSKETNDSPPMKLSSRERFKLQQESLSHKRQALKLRREGRHEEADAEFELAKNLESQLEAANELTKPVEPVDDVSIEDLLDPQLLSALREVGIEGGVKPPPVVKPVVNPVLNKAQTSEPVKGKVVVNKSETAELEEQIKAEKVKAVQLKRAGKQTEALDALRRAKLLEKKLNSLA